MPRNVFHSTLDFLDIKQRQPTSLVKIEKFLNPHEENGIPIYAKLMFELQNQKFAPASNMIKKAMERPTWKDIHTIVVGSSGNMAEALTVLCNLYGKSLLPVVPGDLAEGKDKMLDLVGAQPAIRNYEEPGKPNGIEVADNLGQLDGVLTIRQYHSTDNSDVYKEIIGPEILEQTEDQLGITCAMMGTGGCVRGLKEHFRSVEERLGKILVVGGAAADETSTSKAAAIPGSRTKTRLKQTGLSYHDYIDFFVEVITFDAFNESKKIFRTGIPGGPTSGGALKALLTQLDILQKEYPETYKRLQGKKAVFICPDLIFLYMEKYKTHLDPKDLKPMFTSPFVELMQGSFQNRKK